MQLQRKQAPPPKAASKQSAKPTNGAADDGASPFTFKLKAGEAPPAPPAELVEGDAEIIEVKSKPSRNNPDLIVNTFIFAVGKRKVYFRINCYPEWIDPDFDFGSLDDALLTQYRINIHNNKTGFLRLREVTGLDKADLESMEDFVGARCYIHTKDRDGFPDVDLLDFPQTTQRRR